MARERTTDLEVLEQLVAPAGKDVADVGCGPGALVRALTARGARVVGIEISERQLAVAIDADDGAGARYAVGRGEALPLPDASTDLVVYMRTLHHVPIAAMDAALREARRVLRPHGAVYVVEPLTEGDFFALTSLIDDEREVRAAAQAALARAGGANLQRAGAMEYEVTTRVSGVHGLRARTIAVDPERAPVFDARRDAIAQAFARLGEPGVGPQERVFLQPMRADVLTPAASGR